MKDDWSSTTHTVRWRLPWYHRLWNRILLRPRTDDWREGEVTYRVRAWSMADIEKARKEAP